MMIPRSPTQRVLTPGAVASYVKAAIPGASVASCEEILGGGYAAVWRARLGGGQDGGREVVLKVGPPGQVRQLRYERDLMAAEAAYIAWCGRSVCRCPWCFTASRTGCW